MYFRETFKADFFWITGRQVFSANIAKSVFFDRCSNQNIISEIIKKKMNCVSIGCQEIRIIDLLLGCLQCWLPPMPVSQLQFIIVTVPATYFALGRSAILCALTCIAGSHNSLNGQNSISSLPIVPIAQITCARI